jgi:hypothetical protein
LLVIYDSVLATLALLNIGPADSLDCPLERQWARLFSTKDSNAIRRIQDRHQCCGLNSAHDRAWPFPDQSHGANACEETFNRVRSCLQPWRRDEQMVGGMILVVAVVSFLLKVRCLDLHQWKKQHGSPHHFLATIHERSYSHLTSFSPSQSPSIINPIILPQLNPLSPSSPFSSHVRPRPPISKPMKIDI